MNNDIQEIVRILVKIIKTTKERNCIWNAVKIGGLNNFIKAESSYTSEKIENIDKNINAKINSINANIINQIENVDLKINNLSESFDKKIKNIDFELTAKINKLENANKKLFFLCISLPIASFLLIILLNYLKIT